MTIGGALSDLNNLLNADDIPCYYKPSIKAVIDTIALEQQSCEDCISREAVIKHICESKECYKDECKGRLYKRCFDLQWIYDLPSVTPQQRVGKWMATENEDMNIVGYYCSCCDLPMETEEKTTYCPNCGAKMEVEE